jgi:ABC-type antimicrobial peptide transport system permease subunit
VNKNNNSNRSGGGIGFVGLLTIAFIVLKLLGEITWSWWWVLSPLWISTGIALIILLVVILGAVIALKNEEKK